MSTPQRSGFGKLLGPRAGRDVTAVPAAGTPPAAAPQSRYQPPAQPAGNPKGAPASALATRRTAVKAKP